MLTLARGADAEYEMVEEAAENATAPFSGERPRDWSTKTVLALMRVASEAKGEALKPVVEFVKEQ